MLTLTAKGKTRAWKKGVDGTGDVERKRLGLCVRAWTAQVGKLTQEGTDCHA